MNRDAELLRQQRRAENASRSRSMTQVATIGQRSNNGRYDVVMPDGGVMSGRANKIYNANHNAGDTVIALPRRDGVILLEGPKATVAPDPKVNPLDLAALVDRCDGYINGQIFNCGAEQRVITIAWAIGRQTFGAFGQSQSIALINLITGQVYPLGSPIPTNIPPCGTVPNDYPPLPVPPPAPPPPGEL